MIAAMNLLAALLLSAGTYSLVKALRANRATTLRQPLVWALVAWGAWIGVAWFRVLRPGGEEQLAAYGALCLTGCAGIAVLGARRPGTSAWNFVVVGLLAVLLLPILNGMGELWLQSPQEIFLAGTLVVCILNYLPTTLGPSALLLAAGCSWEMMRLLGWTALAGSAWLGLFLLALAPWTAWMTLTLQSPAATELDRLWLAYRDRFGLVWGLRVQEQYNRAAHHAGWPVVLRWGGLQATATEPSPDPAALVATLRAVLKRFESE
jgi:hypothetical protein